MHRASPSFQNNKRHLQPGVEEKKIILKDIIKVYDKKVKAIDEVSIDIYDKELVVFVGPSGCGKSTLLRMIAGLEDITYGELWIDGVLSNAIQPKDRDIAMVFQNYALYPAMTVYDNIAFGLVSRKMDKKEIDRRVRNAAEQMGLTEYLHRKPLTLSGGQRQRVALCRAIVREPKVFLLDEPLSNLDAKLRLKIKTEIVRLQKKLETTMIYVTHDQTEAMTMADRIVVLGDGKVQQIGTPDEIFNYPKNIFVATFIGLPKMNIVTSGLVNKQLTVFGTVLPDEQLNSYLKDSIYVGIRPNDVKIVDDENLPKFEVIHVEELGYQRNIFIEVEGITFIIQDESERKFNLGDKISIECDITRFSFFDIDSKERV